MADDQGKIENQAAATEANIGKPQEQTVPADPVVVHEPEVMPPDESESEPGTINTINTINTPTDLIPFTQNGIIPALLTNLRETLARDHARMEDAANRIKESTDAAANLMEDYAQEADNSLADLTRHLRKRGV